MAKVHKYNNLYEIIHNTILEVIKQRGSEWCLVSKKKEKSGKRRNLGCYPTKKDVEKREKQIQYFKHKF